MNYKKNKQQAIALGLGFMLIAVVALITFSNPKQEKNVDQEFLEEKVPYISAEELYKKIKKEEKVFIVDIRLAEDFDKEHILNSINIPLENILKNNFQKISADDFIVIVGYDKNKQESYQAWKIFSQKFSNVKVLKGGIEKWKNEGLSGIIGAGDPTSLIDQSKVSFIKLDDLKKIIDENKIKNYYILDVRSSAHFEQDRIINSQNISLDKIESMKKNIPIGKEIIVYGEDELQGFKAGVRLFDLGFFSVLVLQEGFSKWKEKGYPTVR